MDQQKIGAFIKEMRKELGLTQSQLAEKLNISNKAISKWETGGGMPDVSLITPLCEALNITSEELFAGEKAAVPKDESQPVKAKKRYDIVAFIIVFIFIALILVFLIMLSKTISIDKNEISAPTLTSTVTNERTPTIIYTPADTLILTPTGTLAPTPTGTLVPTPTRTPTPTGTPTPTVTQKPTATPVPTATPTLAPTPTPVWGERV
ncbi:MAG: helix-turn-helix domain-containing protein, partial [Clostridia bacterium]|nr:helix-turn-helix domain-containing protein [Clostridia bacterium]